MEKVIRGPVFWIVRSDREYKWPIEIYDPAENQSLSLSLSEAKFISNSLSELLKPESSNPPPDQL